MAVRRREGTGNSVRREAGGCGREMGGRMKRVVVDPGEMNPLIWQRSGVDMGHVYTTARACREKYFELN